MEHRTEEGDPLLNLRCSILTHLNTSIHIMMQQIKESTVNYIRNTDENDKNIKGKWCMVHGA